MLNLCKWLAYVFLKASNLILYLNMFRNLELKQRLQMILGNVISLFLYI